MFQDKTISLLAKAACHTHFQRHKQAANLFFEHGMPTALTTTLAGGLGGAGLGGLVDYVFSPANQMGYDGIITGGLLGSLLGYKARPLVNYALTGSSSRHADIREGIAERETYKNKKPDFEVSMSEMLPDGYEAKARDAAVKYRNKLKTPEGDFRNEFSQSLSPEAFTRKVKGYYDPNLSAASSNRNVRGVYLGAYDSPAEGVMLISPDSRENPTSMLRHELTHSMQEAYDKKLKVKPVPGGYVNSVKSLKAEKANQKFKDLIDKFSDGSSQGKYLSRKAEEEAYLAEIKRKYFEATNKVIDSPEAADEAFKWLFYLDQKDRRSERAHNQLLYEDTNVLASVLIRMFDRMYASPDRPDAATKKEILEYFNWIKHRLPGVVKAKGQENTKVASSNAIKLLAANACKLYVSGLGANAKLA